ncbi:unnamed protein product [Lepeophtheirus salmonis]|uniref:(salmon louse) hypothetical protein n=1 Tax=Lepeophtheirus salmonis TaxID=72036 RepID=A0A7R8CJJ0_LEPSM|nr:unnamed protein product [Lepeophtheirus salmonis]CAF2811782.1 unnamed protein product [Lepeophtheirus salmonis]
MNFVARSISPSLRMELSLRPLVRDNVSLAQKLVTSKFKKEFLWGKCVEMCMERHPREEISSGGNSESSHQIGHRHQNQPGSSGFLKGNNNHHHDENHQGINRTMYNERAYRDRSTCMEDCFISYERVKPHHKIARACIHAACSRSTRASTDTSSLECFDRCAHHVSLSVYPKLECTDRKLWERITKGASVSPDVLLLCLNGLCDHDIKCAKSCLSHVSSDIDPDDLSDWSRCTYSTVCAKIPEYGPRVRCSDKCLKEHKINQRRMFERQRLEAESERQKEEEARALSAGNLGSLSSSYSFQYSRSGSEHVFLSLD